MQSSDPGFTNYSWHKIATSLADLGLAEGELKEWEVAGKKICLAYRRQQLYACAASCPHAGGVMAAGNIDAVGNIVCPVHSYRFSLENGRNTSGEGFFLKRFPIEIRLDGVFVGFANNLPG